MVLGWSYLLRRNPLNRPILKINDLPFAFLGGICLFCCQSFVSRITFVFEDWVYLLFDHVVAGVVLSWVIRQEVDYASFYLASVRLYQISYGKHGFFAGNDAPTVTGVRRPTAWASMRKICSDAVGSALSQGCRSRHHIPGRSKVGGILVTFRSDILPKGIVLRHARHLNFLLCIFLVRLKVRLFSLSSLLFQTF